MLVYLLPLLVTSAANCRLVFDDPTEAAMFNLDAESTATLATDTAFICEHHGGVVSRDNITCEWQTIVQMTLHPSPTPVPTPVPTQLPTPLTVRIA